MEHDTGKVFIGCLFTMTQVADIVILAEDAQQIAVGKKNGAGSMGAHQRVLFSKMSIKA
jgi:hypothetical protein